MLTKDELNQFKTLTRTIIREELEIQDESIRAEMKLMRIRIQADLNKLEDRVKNVQIDLKRVVNFLTKKTSFVQVREESNLY